MNKVSIQCGLAISLGILSLSVTQSTIADQNINHDQILRSILKCEFPAKKLMQPLGVKYTRKGWVHKNLGYDNQPNNKSDDENAQFAYYFHQKAIPVLDTVAFIGVESGYGEEVFSENYVFSGSKEMVRQAFKTRYNVDLAKNKLFNKTSGRQLTSENDKTVISCITTAFGITIKDVLKKN